jgi:hypothetical protein
MRDHDRRIIHSSVESDYRTPMELISSLDEEFHFTTDVCASHRNALFAKWFGPGHQDPARRDALYNGTWGTGPHFINPPYSKKRADELRKAGAPEPEWRCYLIERWAERCWMESLTQVVVGLFPYSSQTAWWKEHVWQGGRMADGSKPEIHWRWHRASEVRLFHHRLSYLDPEGIPTGNSAGVNSAVIVWKPPCGYVEPWVPTVRYWTYE